MHRILIKMETAMARLQFARQRRLIVEALREIRASEDRAVLGANVAGVMRGRLSR